MKTIAAIFFTMLFCYSVFGQNYSGFEDVIVDNTMSVGSFAPADSKSVLDVSSTTKGFLAPRMTTAQQNAIASPTTGLLIYNTTTNSFNVYNGTAWLAGATLTGTETLTDKTITAPVIDAITFDDIATPANPAATFYKLYAKSDGYLYKLNSAGTEYRVDSGQYGSSDRIDNLTLTATVAANALTVAIKTSSGGNPSTSDLVRIGMRSSTAATGTYNMRSISSALSVVVSSGSTLGHISATAERIYVYVIDNAGTIELAVSTKMFDDGTLVTTTAEGGAGAADARETIYSTTARASVPLRLIARLNSNQTTAGTWAAVPTEISLTPFLRNFSVSTLDSPVKIASAIIANAGTPTVTRQDGVWISSLTDNGTGDTTINITSGIFSSIPNCVCSSNDATTERICQIDTTTAVSTTAVRVQTATDNGAANDHNFSIICIGEN